jgi:hypothetical protein
LGCITQGRSGRGSRTAFSASEISVASALVRQAGLQLMDLIMQEEVRELVGERSRRLPDRTANRWGTEHGYCW